jgi:hypothetical protein
MYRLVHFPATEHEELVTAWLWSEQAGVVSHHTALALHGLSDVLPAHIHLTLPAAWRRLRFRVPAGVVLHHADVGSEERTWFGADPAPTLRARSVTPQGADFHPSYWLLAARQAVRRGLVIPKALVQRLRSAATSGAESPCARYLPTELASGSNSPPVALAAVTTQNESCRLNQLISRQNRLDRRTDIM